MLDIRSASSVYLDDTRECSTMWSLLILVISFQICFLDGGRTCASCSGITEPGTCTHTITCDANEECYLHQYRTESGKYLFDVGCILSQMCLNSNGAIIGKRSEGRHVTCSLCCNDTTACNKHLTCDPGGTPRDCSELVLHVDGTYVIYPYGTRSEPVSVFCVFDTNGQAWTVIQKRFDGSVDFYRGWDEYARGFGHPRGEYWLGLENIHELTSVPDYQLRVVLTDWSNVTKYAEYSHVRVGHGSTYYKLTVSGYSGNAGDSMTRHNNHMFSTSDNEHEGGTCAQSHHGAWWYASCHDSNLNGKYYQGIGHVLYTDGLEWWAWHGYYYSLKSTMMMVSKI